MLTISWNGAVNVFVSICVGYFVYGSIYLSETNEGRIWYNKPVFYFSTQILPTIMLYVSYNKFIVLKIKDYFSKRTLKASNLAQPNSLVSMAESRFSLRLFSPIAQSCLVSVMLSSISLILSKT